jgi:hypothetical protein
MTADRLLWLAERLCGAGARRRVFEPLVADWQRDVLDAQGRSRRAWARLRGAAAFIVTLAICANPFRGEDGRPARRFVVAALGFALAATVLQLAPFQLFTTTSAQGRFGWLPVRWDRLLNSPGYFATGVALAMLPAAMLAAGRITRARFVIATGFVLALAFVARDVVAPRSLDVSREVRRAEIAAQIPAAKRQDWIARQQQSDLAERERRRRDATGAWAHIARIDRHQRGAFAAMALAFALLGLAIGRARRDVRISAAAAWWFFTWISYQLLEFLARRLQVVAPAPIEVAIWLPPLAVLIVAMVALSAPQPQRNWRT